MSNEDVRTRVMAGKNVRIDPLAEAAGISPNGLRQAIRRGEIDIVKVGRTVLIPAHVGKRLLGIAAA
jgi:hypothetical protein